MTVQPANDKIKEAALTLLRAIRDEETNVINGKTITFSLFGDDGADCGDWEITVQPTRFPVGQNPALTQ